MVANIDKANEVRDFWFKNSKDWFSKSESFDKQIKDKFYSTLEEITNLEHEEWLTQPETCLAYILVLDQFTRNMFRNTQRMYEYDKIAIKAAMFAVDNKYLNELKNDAQKKFMLMPFMHTESLELQNRGVELFEGLGDKKTTQYAIVHRDIIEKFGRFPHRNEILGRESTSEEIEFLKTEGSSF